MKPDGNTITTLLAAAGALADVIAAFVRLDVLASRERVLMVVLGTTIAVAALTNWNRHSSASKGLLAACTIAGVAIICAAGIFLAILAVTYDNVIVDHSINPHGGTISVQAARSPSTVRLTIVPEAGAPLTISDIDTHDGEAPQDPRVQTIDDFDVEAVNFRRPQRFDIEYESGARSIRGLMRRAEPNTIMFMTAQDYAMFRRRAWMIGGIACASLCLLLGYVSLRPPSWWRRKMTEFDYINTTVLS